MGRDRYNPITPTIRAEASLRPAVSGTPFSTYDEKRADYVPYPSNPGLQWEQLAHALRKWEPALGRWADRAQDRENEELYAKARNLSMEAENLDKSLVQFTQEHPEYAGASPAFQRGWKSAKLERLGMQYDTDLRRAYMENGWVNMQSPEDLRKAKDLWTAAWRKEYLADFSAEEDHPLVNKYFNRMQLQAEDSLSSLYSGERMKVSFAEGEQQHKEYNYSIIDGMVKAPGQDFFHPNGVEQNVKTLGSYLTAARDRIMASGIPEYMANTWIRQSLVQYAEAMDIDANDHRAEALFGVLNRIPTKSGALGGTAESKLALAEFRDKAGDRAWKNEQRWWAQKDRFRSEQERMVTEAVTYGLSENPDATPEEIRAKYNLPNTPGFLAHYNTYRAHQSAASEVRESPENRFLAAELYVQQVEGKTTLKDLQNHYLAGYLTEKQWNSLKGDAPRDHDTSARTRRLVGDSGMDEAEDFIRRAWATTGGLGGVLTGEAKLTQHYQTDTAVTLFRSAVYEELDTIRRNGGEPTREDAMRIVAKHRDTLANPENPIVREQAEARKKSQFAFDPYSPGRAAYREASERGSYTPGYTPSPESVFAYAPARAVRILDKAAREAKVNPVLVMAVAHVESGFREDAKNPTSSAYGYMQLVDGTAAWEGVNKHDPESNALGGAKHLARIIKMHGLNPSDPEDAGKIYMFYHDGPGHQGEHSVEAKAGAKKVTAAVRSAQQEQIRRATGALAPVLWDEQMVAEAASALTSGQPHPAFAVIREELRLSGVDVSDNAEVPVAVLNSALAQLAQQYQQRVYPRPYYLDDRAASKLEAKVGALKPRPEQGVVQIGPAPQTP